MGAVTAKTSVTRPNNTTAYSAGAVVGGAFVLPGMGNGSGIRLMLTSAQFEWDISALPTGAGNFTLYLYNKTPPSGYADGAAWDLPAGDRPFFLGSIALGIPADLGSTLYIEQNVINKQIYLNAADIYAYCVTGSGYTPAASTVQTFTLHGIILD